MTDAPERALADRRAWLIYSREHNAWWRTNSSGYTTNIIDAGRFTKPDAIAKSKVRDPQRDGSISEFAVLAPEVEQHFDDLIKRVREAEEMRDFYRAACDGETRNLLDENAKLRAERNDWKLRYEALRDGDV